MDGCRDYHIKWRYNTERQIPYGITYEWTPNCDACELLDKTETVSEKTNIRLPNGKGMGD